MPKKSTLTVKKSSTRLPLLLMLFLALGVLVCFGVIYAYSQRDADAKLQNSTNQTAEDTVPTGKQAVTVPPSGDKSGDIADAPKASPMTISILDAYQQDDGGLVIQTKIIGSSNGRCNLKVSRSEKIVTKEADVLFQPAYSTCTGFLVPFSELGSTGTWEIKLDLKDPAGNITATTDRSVIIKAQ